ncbi:MAG TPA: hypothetical protein VK166_00625, partial [Chitinophagaceae bacterium]|nr:hypothetical protein [Chitinophagaceae bacterium]
LNTWPSILSAEIGGRPDLFYSKLERDMQVSVKLFDHDWQDIYDELYAGSRFYYAMDACGQSFRVYAVREEDDELKDQKFQLRIRYLQ